MSHDDSTHSMEPNGVEAPSVDPSVASVATHARGATPNGGASVASVAGSLLSTVPVSGDDGDVPIEEGAEWPRPLGEHVHSGFLGEALSTLMPQTESDEAALVYQLLAAYGSVIRRTAHFVVEDTKHYGNLFVVIVGQSSKSRKGTSINRVLALFDRLKGDPRLKVQKGGTSSGEGIIAAVRDASTRETTKGGRKQRSYDPGVADKCLFILESEFSSVLSAASRQGNTITAVYRNAWDGQTLSILTRNDPMTATDPHISIVTHITMEELRSLFTGIYMANGFGNRFMFALVTRSKFLPEGGASNDSDLAPLVEQLQKAVDFGKAQGRIDFDDEARARWHATYKNLSAEHQGVFGAMTARAEAQVRRLAMLIALVNCSPVIRLKDLLAAEDLWRYCEQSIEVLFGRSMGDRFAERIMACLKAHPDGRTQTQIRDLFARKDSTKVHAALQRLASLGLIRSSVEAVGEGRHPMVWRCQHNVGDRSDRRGGQSTGSVVEDMLIPPSGGASASNDGDRSDRRVECDAAEASEGALERRAIQEADGIRTSECTGGES